MSIDAGQSGDHDWVEDGFVDDEEYVDIYPPEKLAGEWPHEWGLSPLNCAECLAPEIMRYPCPECKYNPPRPESETTIADFAGGGDDG